MFHESTQTSAETVGDFFDRFVRLARSFRFGSHEIRDQLVLGTALSEARETIFRDPKDLNVESALNVLRMHEHNRRTLGDFAKQPEPIYALRAVWKKKTGEVNSRTDQRMGKKGSRVKKHP